MIYDKTQESGLMLFLQMPLDPVVSCSLRYLKYFYSYNPCFSPGDSIEKISRKLPFLPSYVPVMLSELSDHMTFMERVKNICTLF